MRPPLSFATASEQDAIPDRQTEISGKSVVSCVRFMAQDQEAGASQAWPGGTTHAECERMVEHALLRNPTVKFMVEKIEEVWRQPGAALRVVHAARPAP